MELSELIGLRPIPAAGLLVTLTRRCPLGCAHCSTSSTMTGQDVPADQLVRFVGSATAADRPEVIMLTGGEPLLRPALVADLAAAARRAGTRTAVLSGMFFARGGTVPARILRAVEGIDHFSASLDVFHERRIPRPDVLAALGLLLDRGIAVSVHVTGTGSDDPYLAEVTAQLRRLFGHRVPALVSEVRAVGRARAWASARQVHSAPEGIAPCAMAAWPVVTFDGTVVACCNQDVVDLRPVPAHLRLGHIGEDGWATIRSRTLGSPVLRMVRAAGPGHLLARFGDDDEAAGGCAGGCGACQGLSARPVVLDAVAAAGRGPAGALLDRTVAETQATAGPVALVRRYGCAAYADLVDPARPEVRR